VVIDKCSKRLFKGGAVAATAVALTPTLATCKNLKYNVAGQ